MDRCVFDDRREAGRRLGAEVARADLPSPLVLGLPRGGIPVAAEVADAIRAPLDVIVVRKLGVPFQPELAMGAVGESGELVLNRDVIRAAHVSEQELRTVEAHERLELDRRLGRIRSVHQREATAGRAVVIVDDGIATGATVRAAILVARADGAASVTVAVPVAPPDVIEQLRTEADRVICLESPEPFGAVGRWYRRFETVTDADVNDILSAHRSPTNRSSEPVPASGTVTTELDVALGPLTLIGDLCVPAEPCGVVVFAHGSGSSRHSPRNRWVADRLQQRGLATLLLDLLTPPEALVRQNVFHVQMLADRLRVATEVVADLPALEGLPIGYFGASTGAAAALCAAAEPESRIAAVVSRGGRPDLAGQHLDQVTAPTLLIVGSEDPVVAELNREAAARLGGVNRLVIVPGASHLFEEPGALEEVARLSGDWFGTYLA